MTQTKALRDAQKAARVLRESITKPLRPQVAIILGTGWGDTIVLDNVQERSLASIPGFGGLGKLDGHDRVVMCGMLNEVWTVALRGRVHLNEHPTDPRVPMMVRLQVQMLCELGVRDFILTNAAGSLVPTCKVGSIVVADGFVTTQIASAMPLFAGEFCNPEDRLAPELQEIALHAAAENGLSACLGGYTLMRGPYFEGRKYDKTILRNTGATAVGMSTFPEMCVLATYPNTRAACLSYITNSAFEEHSHETNQKRAKKDAPKLGNLLRRLVWKMTA